MSSLSVDHVGQRCVSEPELGLGIVAEIDRSRVAVEFPDTRERRIYARGTPVLKRVRFGVGESVAARWLGVCDRGGRRGGLAAGLCRRRETRPRGRYLRRDERGLAGRAVDVGSGRSVGYFNIYAEKAETPGARVRLLDRMDKIFPGNHLLSFFCQAVIWAQPAFYYAYEHHLRDHGAYPWDGDSLAIPIFGNVLFWLVWGPLLLWLMRNRFRKTATPLRLLEWNSERPIFGAVICLGALALIYLTGDEIRHDLKWRNYRDLGYMGCWVVVWLVLRSLLLTKTAEAKPEPVEVESPQVG